MNQIDSSLCACNSGLTPESCCQMDMAAAAAADVPATLHGDAEAAASALRSGDRERAEGLAIDVLESAPLHVPALRTLASVRLDQKRQNAAAVLLERIVGEEPTDYWAVSKLALLELGRQQHLKAEAHARQALRLAPTNPQSHNLMGVALTQTGKAAAGEYHHRKALELSGKRIPMVLSNLALNLKNQGRMQEARELYREAVAAEPMNRQSLLGWAQLEEADRNLDRAKELLDRVEEVSAPTPATRQTRAAIFGREGRADEALAILDAEEQRPLRPIELMERGRLLDRTGRYDEAWEAFLAGKRRAVEMGSQTYLREQARGLAEQLQQFFARERVDILPRAGVRSDVAQPIFILGFPRSGTTLLEQSLSVSPEITAGDELPVVHEIVATMPRLLASPHEYPGALAELWMGDKRDELDSLRDFYLQRARQRGLMGGEARLFTDKMPLNEVHLGLIGLIFPRAPLVHMIRHPLDIMVSAMSNFFTHGGFCGSQLETAAEHLVLSNTLVTHYRKVMDLNYQAVRYEDVVDDQEATMRRVFDFVGVAFDPRALSFEENVRYARTASYAQVTEKLYDRSRYRYRHYLKHLEPALPILEPLIEAWGYEV
ncbi:tetratricopeptide repeat-containing sulfotransferase family protein [Jiella avicenniae]|uniref:Sulfotransferase n=1 Tax=Jiella avicenniae TaxID=2907202 RepID=A0A9X1P4R8_9HYPH|nr:tetratricopeptide repeat-containing sulfotransferase family protein [Jiella avicenniae]MCE7030245.1 sulfotransferase [Jiella avicenniae]